MTPPADTAELMEGLDRHRLVRGSAELYEALLSNEPRRVQVALSHALTHPLAEDVVGWLAVRGLSRPEPPSVEALLAKHGITDLDAFVAHKNAEIANLKRQLSDTRTWGGDALKAASGYSFMTVLLVGIAVMGWLSAFGVLPFTPEVAAKLEEVSDKVSTESGSGTTGARKR